MKKILLIIMTIVLMAGCAAKERTLLDVPATTPQELAAYSTSLLQSDMAQEQKSEWFYSIGTKALEMAGGFLDNIDFDNIDLEALSSLGTVLSQSYYNTDDNSLKKKIAPVLEQVDALQKLSNFGFSI